MAVILVYIFLFVFWAEQVLGLRLSQIKGLSFLNMSYYLLLVAWALKIIKTRKLFEPNDVNKYLILMIFVVLVSIPIKILLDEIPNISVMEEIIYAKNWTNPLILFFILVNIIDNESTLNNIQLGLVLFLFLNVLSTLLVTYGVVEIGTVRVHMGRSAGFAEANQYAAFLVLFIPLLLSFFLNQKSSLPKAISAFFLFLTLMGLFVTGSRGGVLSFLLSMIVYLLILEREKMIRIATVISVVLTLLVVGGISYVVVPPTVREGVSTKFDPSDSADLDDYTSGRIGLWDNGIKLFSESPIFGHGQQTYVPLSELRGFQIVGNSHNDYILHAVEYGSIGLVIFLMLFTKVFQHVWHHFNITTDSWSKYLYASYLAGFLGYVFSMLSVNIFAPRYLFWMYTAIIYKYSQLEMTKRV
jgi:O-antigen ligase